MKYVLAAMGSEAGGSPVTLLLPVACHWWHERHKHSLVRVQADSALNYEPAP